MLLEQVHALMSAFRTIACTVADKCMHCCGQWRALSVVLSGESFEDIQARKAQHPWGRWMSQQGDEVRVCVCVCVLVVPCQS